MDDGEIEAFAQKRRWYQAHVVALVAAPVALVVSFAFPPVVLVCGPSLVLAAIAGFLGDRSLLRFQRRWIENDIWIDPEQGIDGVPLEWPERFGMLLLFVLGAWATVAAVLHVAGLPTPW